MATITIERGQRWESKDRRDQGRQVYVSFVSSDGADVNTRPVGYGVPRWLRAATLRKYYRLVETECLAPESEEA